jgi:xanthosine utilization system XapX-like protein
VKYAILGGLLAVLLAQFPAPAAAILGLLGTVLVTAAAQPAVWAFGCGLLAAPRIRRWTR